jgi:hypothetical protein
MLLGAGLGNGDAAEEVGVCEGRYCNIEFAVGCDASGSSLHVYESGVNVPVAFGTWAAADVFTVQVTGTVVTYLKNDVAFHTSATAAKFPLHLDTAFVQEGAAISDVSVCAVYSAPPTAPTPPPTPPVATCTDTPASLAAIASKISLERTTGSPVKLELLEDGVVRFTDATCLEATLCNTCGAGGGSSSALASDIADIKLQIAALQTESSGLVASGANVEAFLAQQGFNASIDYSTTLFYRAAGSMFLGNTGQNIFSDVHAGCPAGSHAARCDSEAQYTRINDFAKSAAGSEPLAANCMLDNSLLGYYTNPVSGLGFTRYSAAASHPSDCQVCSGNSNSGCGGGSGTPYSLDPLGFKAGVGTMDFHNCPTCMHIKCEHAVGGIRSICEADAHNTIPA